MMSKRELVIRTARVDYSGIGEELVLDVTVKNAKGQDRVFAPTWDMVMASKKELITWEEYTEQYLSLMRERYLQNQKHFFEVCSAGEIVLLCFCRNSVMGEKHCHRYLLADVLVQVATKKLGIDAKYEGEILNYTNRPARDKMKHAQRKRSFQH